MDGKKLWREENGRNKVGKRREWKEQGCEKERMEGIRLRDEKRDGRIE